MRGACDTHIHVYDDRFAAAPTTVLRPPNASVAEYRSVQRHLGLERVVVVQPTTYGLDNALQLEAVADLGDAARAVVVIDDRVSDETLTHLTTRGARGARFHMLPGGALSWDAIHPTAERIEPFGWHVQLQLNGRELPERLHALRRLPTPLVIDHVGRFMPPVTTADAAFDALRRLIDDGRCWVKLSAPYESTHDGAPRYPAVTTLARALVGHAPERMLWASNWPHPGQVDPPNLDQLARLIDVWLPEPEIRRRVLVDNPAEVYDFEPIDDAPAPPPTQETP